jgi:hypothetical protein
MMAKRPENAGYHLSTACVDFKNMKSTYLNKF